jgi:hypothetical protein
MLVSSFRLTTAAKKAILKLTNLGEEIRMNKRRAIWIVPAFVLVLAASIAVAQPGAQPSGSIAGEWQITFMVQGQSVGGTLVLAAEGEKLTGTVETQHTGPGKLQDGKFAASKLSATCVFERHESIDLTGELQGEKLVGTFRTEGREGQWEATRAAKSSSGI